MAQVWTPERRARAAERARTHKPWLRSTGPRSEEGKARSSRNAFKGSEWRHRRDELRYIKTVLRIVKGNDWEPD